MILSVKKLYLIGIVPYLSISDNENCLTTNGGYAFLLTNKLSQTSNSEKTQNSPVQTINEQEKIISKRMETFLSDVASPETVSRSLHRIIIVLAFTLVRNDDIRNPINKEWLDDGIFYLSELSEILNPQS